MARARSGKDSREVENCKRYIAKTNENIADVKEDQVREISRIKDDQINIKSRTSRKIESLLKDIESEKRSIARYKEQIARSKK